MTHLCGADDGLADPVAFASHHFLSKEDLLCWDFDTQISTGHHDAVTSLQDLIKSSTQKGKTVRFSRASGACDQTGICPLAHALVVLQLADDLDVLALLAQNFPDSVDISSFTDEGGKHHVYALFHTELQVLDVFLRHSGQVDGSSRQVDALLAAQHAAVADGAHQVVAAWRHSERSPRLGNSETEDNRGFVRSPTSLTVRVIRPSST